MVSGIRLNYSSELLDDSDVPVYIIVLRLNGLTTSNHKRMFSNLSIYWTQHCLKNLEIKIFFSKKKVFKKFTTKQN